MLSGPQAVLRRRGAPGVKSQGRKITGSVPLSASLLPEQDLLSTSLLICQDFGGICNACPYQVNAGLKHI